MFSFRAASFNKFELSWEHLKYSECMQTMWLRPKPRWRSSLGSGTGWPLPKNPIPALGPLGLDVWPWPRATKVFVIILLWGNSVFLLFSWEARIHENNYQKNGRHYLHILAANCLNLTKFGMQTQIVWETDHIYNVCTENKSEIQAQWIQTQKWLSSFH